MPHVRGFHFDPDGKIVFDQVDGETKVVAVDDLRAKRIAYHAFASTWIEKLYRRSREVYFDYPSFRNDVAQEIYSYIVIRYLSFFKSDATKMTLKRDKVFAGNTEMKYYFNFINDYRDNYLAHNNGFWSSDFAFGLTADDHNNPKCVITLVINYGFLRQTDFEYLMKLCSLTLNWMRRKDDFFAVAIVGRYQKRISSSRFRFWHFDQRSASLS